MQSSKKIRTIAGAGTALLGLSYLWQCETAEVEEPKIAPPALVKPSGVQSSPSRDNIGPTGPIKSTSETLKAPHELALQAMNKAWENRVKDSSVGLFSQHYKITRQRKLGKSTLVQYRQEYGGVPVFLSQVSVIVNDDTALTTAHFGSTSIITPTQGLVSALNADLESIYKNCRLSAEDSFQTSFDFIKQRILKLSKHKIATSDVSKKDSLTEQVLIDDGKHLVPGFLNLISFQDGSDFHSYSFGLSAIDGKLLYINDHTQSENASSSTVIIPVGPKRPFSPIANGASYNENVVLRTFSHADGQPRNPPINSGYSPESRTISPNRYWTGVWDAEKNTFVNSRRTEGNHAIAYIDFKGDTGFQPTLDIYASETSRNRFEYSYLPTLGISNAGNQKFGSLSAFYVANYLHDLFYESGFREDMGAAMDHNFLENPDGEAKYADDDSMLIESLDSYYFDIANRKLNNANMTSLPDGMRPRMQMYAWHQSIGTIIASTDKGVSILDAKTKFGMPLFSIGPGSTQTPRREMAELMRANDGVADFGSIYDGCEKLPSAKDKILVMNRGKCTFLDKAKNAKAAGAVGTIVINDSDRIQDLTGESNFDFPIILVGKQDGDKLLNAMEAGKVSAKFSFQPLPPKDGAMDVGIVSHEWGHYLTNRLVCNTFGLGNSQGKSMGEGFGDFMALLTLVRGEDKLKAGNDEFQAPFNIADFAMSSEITGRYQRRAPYSTDMSINPLTFRHISNFSPLPLSINGYDQKENAEIHNSGEIWTLMLWDAYVELLLNYDFKTARKKMTDFLVAGLSMIPCSPTFSDARNALLSATLALGGEQDFDLISKAFAKRGLGRQAKSPPKKDNGKGLILLGFVLGESNGHAGIEESFEPITVQELKNELDRARKLEAEEQPE